MFKIYYLFRNIARDVILLINIDNITQIILKRIIYYNVCIFILLNILPQYYNMDYYIIIIQLTLFMIYIFLLSVAKIMINSSINKKYFNLTFHYYINNEYHSNHYHKHYTNMNKFNAILKNRKP